MADTNIKLFKSIDSNIDFDAVKAELMTVFKSPNPLQIYLNSKNIKDKFSELLSCLTLKIKE
jgi:hypothetical protein